MKYAYSLNYGLTIDCLEASYRDYAKLQLVCPRCKNPVFLVGAKHRRGHQRKVGDRFSNVREHSVQPAFAHFGGLADEQCENFNFKITKEAICRGNAIARKQQLKIFTDNFLEIISCQKVKVTFFDVFKKNNSVLKNKHIAELYKVAVKDFTRLLRSEERVVTKHCTEMWKYIAEDNMISKEIQNGEDNLKNMINFVKTIDFKFQCELVSGIFKFLCTRSADSLCYKLFDLSFEALYLSKAISDVMCTIEAESIENEQDKYSEIVTKCCISVVHTIAFTDWVGKSANIKH